LDLLGDAIKNCTPNLKKKKDASIDKYKNEVVKPLKDMIESHVQFFADLSQKYQEKSSVDLVPADEIAGVVEFMKSISTDSD